MKKNLVFNCIAFVATAVVLLSVFVDARFVVREGAPPSNLKSVEFALSFTCVSVNGVNHALAQGQSLTTDIEAEGQSMLCYDSRSFLLASSKNVPSL